jgi:hypothetical protein
MLLRKAFLRLTSWELTLIWRLQILVCMFICL